MDYPNSLALEVLETRHPDYTEILPDLKEIYLLTAGGWKLKRQIKQFLPQRIGEHADIYKQRIKKFTYRNILAEAIAQQSNKLSNGVINLSGYPKEDETFWEAFREDVNTKGRTEKALVDELFTESLKFKKIYIHVDKPKSEISPRNRVEEEKLGLKPYLTLYDAFQVINWSETDNKVDWIKIRQHIKDTSNPFIPALDKIIWTFIDNQYVAKYESYVELDDEGKVKRVLNSEGKPIAQGDKVLIPSIGSPIPHNMGETPVHKLELDEKLWVTNQCAPKAYEHLRTDCHKFDLLTAAYFQRSYKKVQIPDNDFTNTFSSDSDAIDVWLEHVLELEDFKWNEPQGNILVHVFSSLQQTASEVRDMVALGGVSAQHAVVEQSGVSKEIDYALQEESLKAYGHVITDALQDIYQLVAKAAGRAYETLSVSGLDNFSLDNLNGLLERMKMIADIDFASLQQKLTPTLFNLLYQKMTSLLIGNLTAEQKALIESEMSKLAPTGQGADK